MTTEVEKFKKSIPRYDLRVYNRLRKTHKLTHNQAVSKYKKLNKDFKTIPFRKRKELSLDREKQALSIARKRGLDDIESSVMVGQMISESGPLMDPTTRQTGSGGKGHEARGVLQWTGSRLADLLVRDKPDTLDTQMNFMIDEMQGKGKVDRWERDQYNRAVKGADSIDSLTKGVTKEFIRPGKPKMERRSRNSNDVFFRNFSGKTDLESNVSGRLPASVEEPTFIDLSQQNEDDLFKQLEQPIGGFNFTDFID